MKTAVAYIRVSTDMQTEYSPASQLKLIKDYALKNDMVLSEIYQDEGISGRIADKRPAFKKMIAEAKKNTFDVILIYNTSRFARNHEESIIYRSMLKKEGIAVISITQPAIDEKTDMLMNALYAVMDERYSLELSENVKRGMKEKVSRGLYISNPPLGYCRTISNKPIEIVKEEVPIIEYIFKKYLDGMGMLKIATNLNAKGYRGKRGKPLDRRGIYRIMRNPVYKGYVSWKCDEEHFYLKADHEPIISEELFDKVNELLDENVNKRAYKSREANTVAHYLTGIVRCKTCGSTYIHVKGYGGRANRFRCGKYGNGSCTNSKSIKAELLEKIFINFLETVDLEKVEFSKEEKYIEIRTNDVEIKKLEKALIRAKEAYLAEIDTIEEYKNNKTKITNEIENLKKNFSIEKQKPKITKKELQDLLEMLYSDASTYDKNKFVHHFIMEVTMNFDTKTIEVIFN